MKPHYLILRLVILILIVPADAQISVPYTSDFEGHEGFEDETPLSGDWATTNNSVVVTDDEAQSGTQSVRIPFAETENVLSLSFDASGSAVLFADYYMQLTASVVPELPSLTAPETTALLAMQSAEPGLGEWLFLDGDGLGSGLWFTAGDAVPLDDSDRTGWHRITLRFDLASNAWDAYVDEKLLAINLGFAEALTADSEAINIYGSQEGVAYLDTFRLAAENPLFDDADLDGIEDAFDLDSAVDDRDLDPDEDGLTNIEEYAYGTNPEVFNADEGILSEVLYNRTNWYVDSVNGDDVSGVGSAAAPFKSLSAVLSLNAQNPGYLEAGDTLYLAAGEYVSTITEIDIAGLTIEGALNSNDEPMTQIVEDIIITADAVTLKNLDFHNAELTLRGATNAEIANNAFSGSVNTGLSLIGASDNVIRNNHFASAIHQCVFIYWDEVTGQASNDNRFLSNYFTHRPTDVTNQIIYCNWTVEDPASICARNRFVDCAFEETVSGQLNKVIYDGSSWWMVVDDAYSVRFEDCYFKRADRDGPFSEFKIVEGHPDFQWRWDELTNDAWVSLNYQYAITGDYNGWDHLPRVQFVDGDDNGSAIETSHTAGLRVVDDAVDDDNPVDPGDSDPTLTDRTDWYVDAINGDDATGIGSEAEPFKSLAAALSLNVNHPGFVGVGDTIYLAEGQYAPAPLEIAIAGLTLEGALDDDGMPLTKIGNLKVTAADVTLKNLDFHNTELTLQGATGALITNNAFSGSVNTGLSLIGASNNVISHNHFASAIHQCVSIYWDEATGQASDDNLFLSNYFTHRPSDVTNQIIYCDWTAANVASICARNRFVDCAFEETVSGQLNKVIYDVSTWWMVVDDAYSVRFEDCYFKKADRLTAFSQFDIIEVAEEPDAEWFWDELLNDEWVAPDYEHAITGDHNNWDHLPRVQFVDSNENGLEVEQEHSAGLLDLEVDNYAPVVENPIASVTVGKDAEPGTIDLYNVFEDVETADADLTFSVVNTNSDLMTSEITDGTLTLEYSNTSSTGTITVTATDDYSENPKSVSAEFEAIIFIDEDGDGLTDEFEQVIIDFDPDDDITSLEDVLPEADFDGDGYSNQLEFTNGTVPTDQMDNSNVFLMPNYSLIHLGEDYLSIEVSNRGHVFMRKDGAADIGVRRWYWNKQIEFYTRYVRGSDSFRPYFKFTPYSMNNHGELVGVYCSKKPDRTIQEFPCGKFIHNYRSEVRNFYERPVIIGRDGSVSVKTPPSETKGQNSIDNTEYRAWGINDNGDYLLRSTPFVSYVGRNVSGSTLGNFTHKYVNGNYIKVGGEYQYGIEDPITSDCHAYVARKGSGVGPDEALFPRHNNQGLIAGMGFTHLRYLSNRFDKSNNSRVFNFVGSLQNEVPYQVFNINQNNLIIGKLENSSNVNLFDGSARYEIPNNIGIYEFRDLSSPAEGEPLMLLAKYHLAVQKRDPQTGELVPISDGADAYTITSANQMLYQPDAAGNPTQNSEWSSPIFSVISDNGDFIAGNVIKNGVYHAVLWVKMDMAVDNNRDGEIEFGKSDQTTEDEPYRFWINDDHDGDSANSFESGDSDTKDHETFGLLDNDAIKNVRDLEDFFRLWIDLPDSIIETLENEDLKLGLKWTNTSGSPAVNLYKAVENDGGLLYLSDTSTAEAQIEGEFDNPIKSVDGNKTVTTGATFVLKKEVFDGIGTTRDSVFLICEGAGVGKGKLQLVILDSDGNEIGTGPGVWMDLLNVKSMYERALASVSFSEPWSYAESDDLPSFSVSVAADSQGYTFTKPHDETEECLVFVHGWKMEAPDVEVFGETMFKRLWWQGYKGRYRVFRWPTYTGDYSFSDSEFMAWKCGAALKNYVEGNVSGASLPIGYSTKVAAHSLGNVVVGGALADGLALDRYLMMQAAIPSGCFNTSDAVNGLAHPGAASSAFNAVPGMDEFVSAFGQQENMKPSPDHANPDSGYRGYLEDADVLRVTNFCNPEDFALTTGDFWGIGTNWLEWQISYKPRQRTVSGRGEINFEYDYFPQATVGERLKLTRFIDSNHDTVGVERFVGDTHESMAQIARTRSLPAGADQQVGGAVTSTIDLREDYGFSNTRADHSGQFRRSIQTVYDLYGTIITALE